MPTLNWMGKEKVVNHHRDVPYRVLERVPEKGVLDSHGSDCGNMVIHGDNLEALKALLPEYEGRVDCAYIDPPYNTGNEGWVYNDNVNDPRIRKWLDRAVGKEGEDFCRHDKWLCMMYPRLQLLRKLLAPTGAIFISIDDNEESNLKLICDEIFSPSCFVARVTWQNNNSPRNDAKGIPYTTDNIFVYGKQPGWQPSRLPRTDEMDDRYSSPDSDPIPWTSSPAHAPGASTHTGMVYAIQHPITRELMYPPSSRHWTYGQDIMLAEMSKWSGYELRVIPDSDKRREICLGADVPEDLPAIMLTDESEATSERARERFNEGLRGENPWPSLYFTSGGKGGMRVKKHLSEMLGKAVPTLWPSAEVGTTTEATAEIKKLFDGRSLFDTPKPTRLIERVLQIATDRGALVLDSFAGSGTTAHAILNANKADSGNRRFILVELDNYADTITAERVRRVIAGYGGGNNAVDGVDSGFSYYELGPALFRGDGTLSPDVTRADLARYVWATETRAPYVDLTGEHPCLLGVHAGAVYYLAWKPGEETALTYDLLRGLPRKGSPTVIYADRCAIAPERLDEMGVVFKRVPDQIARI